MNKKRKCSLCDAEKDKVRKFKSGYVCIECIKYIKQINIESQTSSTTKGAK